MQNIMLSPFRFTTKILLTINENMAISPKGNIDTSTEGSEGIGGINKKRERAKQIFSIIRRTTLIIFIYISLIVFATNLLELDYPATNY
jgi:hypothetical protein